MWKHKLSTMYKFEMCFMFLHILTCNTFVCCEMQFKQKEWHHMLNIIFPCPLRIRKFSHKYVISGTTGKWLKRVESKIDHFLYKIWTWLWLWYNYMQRTMLTLKSCFMCRWQKNTLPTKLFWMKTWKQYVLWTLAHFEWTNHCAWLLKHTQF